MKRFEPLVVLRDAVTRWDVLAFIVVIGLIVFLGETSRGLFAPLTALELTPISLDPRHLPEYAARTTFRMFAALALSLVFTLTYATWAAKSERAGKLLVPILDILQSVPILGFISITVVFFMSLRKCEKLRAPNRLKRVCATGVTANSAVILFAMPQALRMCNLSAS